MFGGWDIFPDDALSKRASHAGVTQKRLSLPRSSRTLRRCDRCRACSSRSGSRSRTARTLRPGRLKRYAEQLIVTSQPGRSKNDVSRFASQCGVARRKCIRPRAPFTRRWRRLKRDRCLGSSDCSVGDLCLCLKSGFRTPTVRRTCRSRLPRDAQAAKQQRSTRLRAKGTKTGQTLMKTVVRDTQARGCSVCKAGIRRTSLETTTVKCSTIPTRLRPRNVEARRRWNTSGSRTCIPSCTKVPHHVVRINYPPRGDNKEGWDNIDIFGWLAIRCRSGRFSVSARLILAPIVLTIRAVPRPGASLGLSGVQEWRRLLQDADDGAGLYPEHDLFIQLMKLKHASAR